MKIGITERGDAALDTGWLNWVLLGSPAILITKNPGLLAEKLSEVPIQNIIIHCTITGFGGSILEPGVPPFQEAIEGYKSLVKTYSKDRAVLRVDPIIPTEKGIEKAKKVIEAAKGSYGRIRISFLDNYSHVKKRFEEAKLPIINYNFHAPLSTRKTVLTSLEELAETKLEVCGEPEMECTGCVSIKDIEILTPNVKEIQMSKQRPACACLAMKQELLLNRKQCAHGCLYCYWKG